MNNDLMQGNLRLDLDGFVLESGEFTIPLKGVTVLFGRSGSGKSTLLRAIAGLDKRTQGQLKVGEEVWQKGGKALATQKRNIGFVFQDAALFPHMTVRQNLDYGIKRLPKENEPANFDDIVQRIGIAELLDREVTFLSGGERQRVAIARALLMRPTLLCMDEPLSALDWRAKAELLHLIESVVEAYQIPVIYITHAPAEVERLADQIVFMSGGQIERIEDLQSSLSRPDSPLFEDEGVVSVLTGQPQNITAGLRPIVMDEQTIWLSDTSDVKKTNVRVRVLAKDVSLALTDPKQLSIMNHLPASIEELIYEEKQRVLVRLKLTDGQYLFSEITQFSAERLKLCQGLQVFALIKSVALAE